MITKINRPKQNRNGYNALPVAKTSSITNTQYIKGDYLPATKNEDGSYSVDAPNLDLNGTLTTSKEFNSEGCNTALLHFETNADGLADGYYSAEINCWEDAIYIQLHSPCSLTLCSGGGEVGIGCYPSRNQKLDVLGNIRISGPTYKDDPMNDTSKNPLLIFADYENGRLIQPVRIIYSDYNTPNGEGTTLKVIGEDKPLLFEVEGNIKASGEITAYSDARLKSNIKPLEDRGRLKPVTYKKDGKDSIGFIAQDVLKLYPELVTEGEYLSLNYAQLTAVLASQLNKAMDKIDLLEDKLEKILTRIKKLDDGSF